ncbi:hypothetical protein B0H16DRAFT_1457497 [Mycena metata]|uniref:Uncharacterized protein n=1 Tax=Mycena metata TaxID=1033252 RepID=A0AAD7J7J3_9AGAR|nr:hypothetical protein B0H16DRAFT_1457497 [Mycena metata]
MPRTRSHRTVTSRRSSPPVPPSPPRRESPPVPESPPPATRRRSPPVPASPLRSRRRESPPVPPSVPQTPKRARPAGRPPSPLSPTGVHLKTDNPVRAICWTEDGKPPKRLTIYPRCDSGVRLADNKVVLGAHCVEIGNTVQRFIMLSRQGGRPVGFWSTIRWGSAIPVRREGHILLLRYKGVFKLADWEEIILCVHGSPPEQVEAKTSPKSDSHVECTPSAFFPTPQCRQWLAQQRGEILSSFFFLLRQRPRSAASLPGQFCGAFPGPGRRTPAPISGPSSGYSTYTPCIANLASANFGGAAPNRGHLESAAFPPRYTAKKKWRHTLGHLELVVRIPSVSRCSLVAERALQGINSAGEQGGAGEEKSGGDGCVQTPAPAVGRVPVPVLTRNLIRPSQKLKA